VYYNVNDERNRREPPVQGAHDDSEQSTEKPPNSPLYPSASEGPSSQRRLRPNPPARGRPKTDFIIQPGEEADDDASADEASTEPTAGASEQASASQRERAERALGRLREKMAEVATEFANGKINRAQFNAIYSRYNEQRQITERLLERNPKSQAWKQVVKEGHTSFLRQHYQAHLLSYALYDNASSMPLYSAGGFKIDTDLLVPMLSSFRAATSEMFGGGLKSTEIEGGRWLVFIPGSFTTSIILFSREPSDRQLDLMQDMHRDFERANHQILETGVHSRDELVFPQRALFKRRP
jgi:hypothetical protein